MQLLSYRLTSLTILFPANLSSILPTKPNMAPKKEPRQNDQQDADLAPQDEKTGFSHCDLRYDLLAQSCYPWTSIAGANVSNLASASWSLVTMQISDSCVLNESSTAIVPSLLPDRVGSKTRLQCWMRLVLWSSCRIYSPFTLY